MYTGRCDSSPVCLSTAKFDGGRKLDIISSRKIRELDTANRFNYIHTPNPRCAYWSLDFDVVASRVKTPSGEWAKASRTSLDISPSAKKKGGIEVTFQQIVENNYPFLDILDRWISFGGTTRHRMTLWSRFAWRACALMTRKLLGIRTQFSELCYKYWRRSNDWNTYQQACQAPTLQDWNNACFDHSGDHPDSYSRVRRKP